MSSKLLEEARKLEMMVGRQQVKTRMEKSPFNVINNQASGQSTMAHTARGGELAHLRGSMTKWLMTGIAVVPGSQ